MSRFQKRYEFVTVPVSRTFSIRRHLVGRHQQSLPVMTTHLHVLLNFFAPRGCTRHGLLRLGNRLLLFLWKSEEFTVNRNLIRFSSSQEKSDMRPHSHIYFEWIWANIVLEFTLQFDKTECDMTQHHWSTRTTTGVLIRKNSIVDLPPPPPPPPSTQLILSLVHLWCTRWMPEQRSSRHVTDGLLQRLDFLQLLVVRAAGESRLHQLRLAHFHLVLLLQLMVPAKTAQNFGPDKGYQRSTSDHDHHMSIRAHETA